MEAEYEAIAMKQSSELWLADLDNFEKAVKELYAAKKDTEKVAEKAIIDADSEKAAKETTLERKRKTTADANASAMDVDGKDVPELDSLSGGPMSPEHRELESEENTKRKQPKKDRRRKRKKPKKDEDRQSR